MLRILKKIVYQIKKQSPSGACVNTNCINLFIL